MHAIFEFRRTFVAILFAGMNMVAFVPFLVFVVIVFLLLVTGSALVHSDLAVSAIHNHRAIVSTTTRSSCRFNSSFPSAVSIHICIDKSQKYVTI